MRAGEEASRRPSREAEEPKKADIAEEVRDHKPLLIGLVVFNLVAFGALSYLRRRHRLRESS